MKHFKNLSLIASFALFFVFSSCTGITDANQSVDGLVIESEDMRDQDIREGGEDMEMIRVRPD